MNISYKDAMDLALSRSTLSLKFPDSAAATDFRHRCYTWRKKQAKQGITDYDCIVIRKAKDSAILRFETGQDGVEIIDEGVELPPSDGLLAEAEALRDELGG